jgi:hypothetical protein
MRRHTQKETKEYIAFYLEPSIKEKMQLIVDNPNTMFDNLSALIRYCIKSKIPEIEKELNEQQQNVPK